MSELNTLITKWVVEDKLNNEALGRNIRKHYWREIHSYEHWLEENNQPDDALDYMYGGGDDDVVDNSSVKNKDTGNFGDELSGQELDDLYGPI